MENLELMDKNIIKKGTVWTLVAAGGTWVDSTTYPRGQWGKVPPTTFKLDLTEVKIMITCDHIHYKGKWVMDCHGLNLKEIQCRDCKTATEAAEYAVKMVKYKLEKLNEVLSNL